MKKYFVFAIMMMACVCGSVSLTACGSDDDDLEVVDKSKVMTADDLVGKWYGVYFEKEDRSDAVNAMLQIEKGGKYKMFVEGMFGNYSQVEDGTFTLSEVSDGWYKVKFHSEVNVGGFVNTYEWSITVKWSDKKHDSMEVLYGDKWVRK